MDAVPVVLQTAPSDASLFPSLCVRGGESFLGATERPLRGGVHKVSVSGVKPGEDQEVSKPVNHGGMHASTLHKPR